MADVIRTFYFENDCAASGHITYDVAALDDVSRVHHDEFMKGAIEFTSYCMQMGDEEFSGMRITRIEQQEKGDE